VHEKDEAALRPSIQGWGGRMRFDLYKARHTSSMAGTVKETALSVRGEPEVEIKALLNGTDVAWTQYKRDHGTRATSATEQDAFLNSL
jgi:hypothetical protein